MTILSTDIKLMASERLTDNDDGGGQMSAVEIQDGVVNNLFPDISRLDRTYGRVALRKLYVAVRTANRDTYYGSHAIITDAPDDPNVSVLMFSTGSYTDERTQARDRIESYVVKGPISRYYPLGDQIEGQRTVRLYARPEAPLPEIGNVYLMSEEDKDGEVLGEQQYVRVQEVSHEIQTFTDDKGDFERRVITIEISDPLRRTYPGNDAPSRFTAASVSPTKFRDTTVADAARYYGIVPLDEPISQGDMTLKCSSIYGQLVPSATAESPVADVQAGSDATNVVASGPAYSVSVPVSGGSCSFGRAMTPGSISINGWTDDGKGTLKDGGGVKKGDVDYAEGVITGLPISGTHSLTATPATAIAEPAMTDSEAITLSNRGYNYIKTLFPTPQPGTLVIDYMAQGEWYRMRDDGTGQLTDGFGGTATLDFSTGTVIATLGALPDTDTAVIYSWATPEHYEQRTADPDIELPYMALTVSAGEIIPGSLTLTWEAGGVTKTATDNGTGDLQGDAEGRVIYALGEIGFKPHLVPTSGAILTIEYQKGITQIETFTNMEYVQDGSTATFTLPGAPIRPGTAHFSFAQSTISTSLSTVEDGLFSYQTEESQQFRKVLNTKTSSNTSSREIGISDNGDGTLSDGGTINYTTGEVTLYVYGISSSSRNKNGRISETTYTYSIASAITAQYQQDSVIPADQTETAPLPDVTLDLLPTVERLIVPSSVEFIWGGKTYIDRNGSLYTDWDRSTGAAALAGSIDYSTGRVTFSGYAGGSTNAVTIKTMLAKYESSPTVTYVQFRTPGAPLRPSSLFVRAVTLDGSVISATADNNGVINSDKIEGTVSYETGVVELYFRQYLTAAEVPAALMALPGWAEAADQGDGTYYVTVPIDASSVKFNAVVYSMLPLSADILGLDPVRLPVDGRVPIIRSGDVVVIHSTQTDTLPNPVSAGQTITLSRDQLASVVLEDSEGTKLDTALYTTSRETGTVTLADPLDLTGYIQPLQVKHRVEDMALVNEAQINGQISIVGGISRAYDPADTWVSSALIFGDLGSRVHHQFSQATWTSEWSDDRIGNPTTAQYNDLLYPIQVDNKNSIRERWAIIFTSSTTFNIVGEVSGVIGTGNTSTDCTPLNPVTGEPYFTILAAGWGSGWATNNVFRFNTDAAHAPVWIARTTISGAATKEDDSFRVEARGDAD